MHYSTTKKSINNQQNSNIHGIIPKNSKSKDGDTIFNGGTQDGKPWLLFFQIKKYGYVSDF